MMILLPPFIEALLRHGCRLFIAGTVIWIGVEGFTLFGGEGSRTRAYFSSGSTTTSTTQSAESSTQTANLQPTPYALLCVPTDHVMQFRGGDAKAMEYEASIQRQLIGVIYDLNNPDSHIRQRNPGKGFVIIVNKREDRYTPAKAKAGLISLTTTIAYEYKDRAGEEYCPPYSVRAQTHPRHRPEFSNSSYTPEWKSVPTLGSR